MSISPTPMRTAIDVAFDRRVSELYRMNKGRLVPLWNQLHPNTIYTATPPMQWSKDELISEILRAEFPVKYQAGA